MCKDCEEHRQQREEESKTPKKPGRTTYGMVLKLLTEQNPDLNPEEVAQLLNRQVRESMGKPLRKC